MIPCSCSSSGAQSTCSDQTLPRVIDRLLSHADQPPGAEQCPGGMGGLESLFQSEGADFLRQALEKAVQVRADSCPPSCFVCGTKLVRKSSGHKRTVQTLFGQITFSRLRGWCSKCQSWRIPADEDLLLEERAKASPGMQEVSALLVSRMPAQEAQRVAQRLLRITADDSTMAREARRQGEKAMAQRSAQDELANDASGRWAVTQTVAKELPNEFTLVIMIDAWMIRERDEWGYTKELAATGTPVSRWHWVYTATVFRLDQRGTDASGRPFIVSRGYVATRMGIEDFTRHLYAEAVRQGLLKASRILAVADGAAWIWNIVSERFGQAEQRLDAMHAAQHLYAVAEAVFGSGNEQGKTWVKALRSRMLEGDGSQVREALAELIQETSDDTAREKVKQEAHYFENHTDRMKYAQGRERNEPIGSGAMESTCRQYQCRFKRCGMFWSREGDEALMALETAWRNNKWDSLFPRLQDGMSMN